MPQVRQVTDKTRRSLYLHIAHPPSIIIQVWK
jgi:hypothetical protein